MEPSAQARNSPIGSNDCTGADRDFARPDAISTLPWHDEVFFPADLCTEPVQLSGRSLCSVASRITNRCLTPKGEREPACYWNDKLANWPGYASFFGQVIGKVTPPPALRLSPTS